MRRLAPLAAVLALALPACGGGSGQDAAPQSQTAAPETTAPEPEPTTEQAPPTGEETTTEEAAPPPPEAPPGVPGFVAGYRGWTKLNADPIPPRASDPHNGTKNVYASKERRANGTFPNGTIVVKDARRPGADFIGLIAIMRKEQGADPEHNDWVFVEYTRDARGEPFAEIASGSVCWSCHAGALDLDYVFTE